eukprot:2891301-Rhodomonas_salina.3
MGNKCFRPSVADEQDNTMQLVQHKAVTLQQEQAINWEDECDVSHRSAITVSYTHLRAHETEADL